MSQTNCYCLKLRRASQSLTKYYDRALVEVGLTLNQYALLKNVSFHPNITISELAKLMSLERSTITRTLKPLIQKNLIQDKKRKGERNSQLVITTTGYNLYLIAQKIWNKAQQEVEKYIGNDIHILTDLLTCFEHLS